MPQETSTTHGAFNRISRRLEALRSFLNHGAICRILARRYPFPLAVDRKPWVLKGFCKPPPARPLKTKARSNRSLKTLDPWIETWNRRFLRPA